MKSSTDIRSGDLAYTQDAGSPDLAGYRHARLDETLSFVGDQSPYYRGLLKQLYGPARSGPEEILRSVPPLSKAQWEAERAQLRTGPATRIMIGYARGTSAGAPSPILSVAEDFRGLKALQRPGGQAGPTLLLVDPGSHGMAELAPQNGNVIVHALSRPEHYEQVRQILDRTAKPFAPMAQVRQIDSTLSQVKALSFYLMRHRGRMDDLGVDRLTVVRNILTPRWRHLLETWWDAQITPMYGFSEMRMCTASECGHCGYFHMPITGLAEVLDEDACWSRVRPGGRGMLAVTGFWPYIQLEPRIRYLPGDLAELAPTICPQWGEHGFRPLGRRSDSVRTEPGGPWVCPADVYPAIADRVGFNWVPTRSRDAQADPFIDKVTGPRWRLEAGDPVTLHIELGHLSDVRYAKRTELHDAIQAEIPAGVEIVAHEPGTLDTWADY